MSGNRQYDTDVIGTGSVGMATVQGVDALSQPLALPNGAVLRNRLAKAALSEGLGRRDFSPGSRIKTLYQRWADNGLGLIITGNMMIDPRAIGEPGNIVVEDERNFDDLVEWAQIAKAGGSAVWAQINHPGRQVPRSLSAQPVAPSPIAIGGTGGFFAEPRELTPTEIEDLIQRFATTAGILVRAGFDGVQFHAAHGYLISQFLSPLANQRTDEWGGTPEKRRRFVLEVARAIRAEIGPAAALSIKLNSADFQRGGFSEQDSLEVVHALAEECIDLVEISGGTYASAAMLGVDPSLKESTRQREAFFLDYAERVRAELPSLPLMLTGGFRTADAMNDAVASGAVDLVGLGRPLSVEPDLPGQLLTGHATGSHVRPRRSGIRLLDNLTELTYYTVQLWRMADGKEPAPGRHPILNVSQYIVRNGRDSIRMPRRRPMSPPISAKRCRLGLLTSLVGVLLLAAPALAVPGVAPAGATYTVDATTDRVDANPGDGVCLDSMGTCTLRAAVMEANADVAADIIVVPTGRYLLTIPPPWTDFGDPLTGADPRTGDLNIGLPVTIRGAGIGETVIDGNQQSRVFANATSTRITDLTLTHGRVPAPPLNAPSGGGAIWNSADLTLERVEVVANTAEYGAGIFNSPGSFLTIRDSLVADNLGNEAGGIRFDSGGLVVNTTITRNRVERRAGRPGEFSGYGGGIDSRGVGGTLDIIRSVITDNYASDGGGGINVSQGYLPLYPLPGQTVVRLEDTIVTGNTSAAGPSDCRSSAGIIEGQGGNTDSDASCPD